jgi:hypothetical protein
LTHTKPDISGVYKLQIGRNKKYKKSNASIQGWLLIDLDAIGMGVREFPAIFTTSDTGVITTFEATLTGLSDEQCCVLSLDKFKKGQPTKGRLLNGSEFSGTIEIFGERRAKFTQSEDQVLINGNLGPIEFRSSTIQMNDARLWSFSLINYQPWLSDPYQKPFNSIAFKFSGRTWQLINDKFNKTNQKISNKVKKVLISGTLQTAYQSGDNEAEMRDIAYCVTKILSVAFSRVINWTTYEIIGKRKKDIILRYERNAWREPFSAGGFAPIDNYSFYSLKTFVEAIDKAMEGDPEWMQHTLFLINQAQIASMVDSRISLLYAILDRITSHIVGKSTQSQIDPHLSSRASKSEFINELHAVFTKLSLNWSRDHTNRILEEAKRWNKTPSFAKKIKQACEKMSLAAPSKEIIKARNDLLHDGSLQKGKISHIYLELEWIVLALFLRMIGYDGVYYHRKFGNSLSILKKQLQTSTSPASKVT